MESLDEGAVASVQEAAIEPEQMQNAQLQAAARSLVDEATTIPQQPDDDDDDDDPLADSARGANKRESVNNVNIFETSLSHPHPDHAYLLVRVGFLFNPFPFSNPPDVEDISCLATLSRHGTFVLDPNHEFLPYRNNHFFMVCLPCGWR